MNTADAPSEHTRTPYAQARKGVVEHALRAAEVPLEHYVSTPLPTLRWETPAYAVFAAPAVRAPRQPLLIDAPDRWWAVGITRPRLLMYALVSAAPFSDAPPGGPVTVSPSGRPLSAVREDQRLFDALMDRALPSFLAGSPGDPTVRGDLAATLALVLPRECRDWSLALTPDFYTWLEQ